jgi:hypothetical protein
MVSLRCLLNPLLCIAGPTFEQAVAGVDATYVMTTTDRFPHSVCKHHHFGVDLNTRPTWEFHIADISTLTGSGNYCSEATSMVTLTIPVDVSVKLHIIGTVTLDSLQFVVHGRLHIIGVNLWLYPANLIMDGNSKATTSDVSSHMNARNSSH